MGGLRISVCKVWNFQVFNFSLRLFFFLKEIKKIYVRRNNFEKVIKTVIAKLQICQFSPILPRTIWGLSENYLRTIWVSSCFFPFLTVLSCFFLYLPVCTYVSWYWCFYPLKRFSSFLDFSLHGEKSIEDLTLLILYRSSYHIFGKQILRPFFFIIILYRLWFPTSSFVMCMSMT